MQETNSASEGTSADDCEEAENAAPGRAAPHAPAHASSVEALTAELAKWRERVPKLAAALKARTDEVAALKARLQARDASVAGDTSGSAIEARDELIAELEQKLADLGTRHQEAEGLARARDVQVASLKQEVNEWRGKWRKATASLDEQARSSGTKDGELARLAEEVHELSRQKRRHADRVREQDLELTALRERTRSLESRNEKLFETTELANRQIETLGGNLELLRSEVKARKAELKAKDEELAARSHEIEKLGSRLAAGADRSGAELAGLRKRLDAREAEIGRLEECVARADETNSQWEVERRELSARLEEYRHRNEHLTAQLSERSELVRGLEQERGGARNRASTLEAENAKLREALEAAQRAAGDNADHVAQLNDRLERQKQLMDDLEQEFAEIQEEYADARKAHRRELADRPAGRQPPPAQHTSELEELRRALSAAEARLMDERQRAESLARALDERELTASQGEERRSEANLRAEVQKLEGMVRERTEALNELRWQHDMIEKQGRESADNKMLVVLNQQLASAREDNKRLLTTIRELESRLAANVRADDLSRIRGIGPKLIKQLAEMDITSFEQLASLKEADLDREDHPLHAIKGRILKDDWMRQAARLAGSD